MLFIPLAIKNYLLNKTHKLYNNCAQNDWCFPELEKLIKFKLLGRLTVRWDRFLLGLPLALWADSGWCIGSWSEYSESYWAAADVGSVEDSNSSSLSLAEFLAYLALSEAVSWSPPPPADRRSVELSLGSPINKFYTSEPCSDTSVLVDPVCFLIIFKRYCYPNLDLLYL